MSLPQYGRRDRFPAAAMRYHIISPPHRHDRLAAGEVRPEVRTCRSAADSAGRATLPGP